jgi:hypothetical protein
MHYARKLPLTRENIISVINSIINNRAIRYIYFINQYRSVFRCEFESTRRDSSPRIRDFSRARVARYRAIRNSGSAGRFEKRPSPGMFRVIFALFPR